MRTCRFWKTMLAITLALQVRAFTSQTQAATKYWSGSGTWATTHTYTDWGTTAGVYTGTWWTNTSDANFAGAAGTATISGTVIAHSITFAVNGYTITGGTALQFSVSGASVSTSGATGTDTISSTISGSNGFTETGPGTLILSGNNSGYAQAILVNQGTLQVGSATALGTNAANLNGGTLDLNGYTGITTPLGLYSSSTGTLINSSPNAASCSGSFALYSTLTVNTTAGNITLSGALTNGASGAITKTGTGTLILSGPSSAYTGVAVINQGTLQLGSASALGTGSAQPNGGTLDLCGISPTGLGNIAQLSNYSGTLTNSSGTASTVASPVYLYNNMYVNTTNANITLSGILYATYGTLTKTGTGTLILSGNSGSNYSGVTYINQGTVQVGSATALGTNSASLNGGTLDLDGISPTGLGNIAQLSGSPSTLTNSSGTGSTVANTVYLYNNMYVNTTNANITLQGALINGTNGTLTKTGTGTLTLSGNSTAYTGAMVINQGTVQLGSATALGTNSAQPNGGTLDLNGYSPTGLGNIAQLSNYSGTLTNSSGTASTVANNVYLYNNMYVNTTNGNITLSGALINGTNGTLTKIGSGTLILSGNNGGGSYTAVNYINQGTVQLGSATALGTNSASLNGGTLDLCGVSPTGLSNIAQLSSYSGTLTNSSGTASTVANTVYLYNNMAVNTTAGNITLSGTLYATYGALTKTGTGTLILSGNSGSNYSGVTYINQGTVQVGSATALGTNSATLQGGTLDLDGISPTGLGNIAQLSGSSTLANSSGTASTVANPVYLYANLNVNATGNIAVSGSISGGYGLTKLGAGTLTLSVADAYSGVTTVGTTVGAGGLFNVTGAVDGRRQRRRQFPCEHLRGKRWDGVHRQLCQHPSRGWWFQRRGLHGHRFDDRAWPVHHGHVRSDCGRHGQRCVQRGDGLAQPHARGVAPRAEQRLGQRRRQHHRRRPQRHVCAPDELRSHRTQYGVGWQDALSG